MHTNNNKSVINTVPQPVNTPQKIQAQNRLHFMPRARMPVNPATLIAMGILSAEDTDE